jgi:hypothetical protein
MARHAIVDLTQIFNTPPLIEAADRLPPEQLDDLRRSLAKDGIILNDDSAATEKLKRLRSSYEPHVRALADYLVLKLPPFRSDEHRKDNWQTSAWKKLEGSATMTITEEHF